jgi:hypothetical protein
VFKNSNINKKKNIYITDFLNSATVGIFYLICIFALPCVNIPDYTQDWCLFPWLFEYNILLLYDVLINDILPSVFITISNILLFVRVIKQKQSLRQQVQWQKYRRMIIRLASCSALFLLFNLPLKYLSLAYIFGLQYGATMVNLNYL